ncbi:hypothetical protein BKI52_13655 [marine bacterium AO1-C]|nr:hypothetical protein BKI52_13655 [marine bacterium AO1-C]
MYMIMKGFNIFLFNHLYIQNQKKVKNSKIYLTLLFGCLIATISCSKKAEEIKPTALEVKVKKPGQFGLAQMTTNQRIRKQIINGVTYIPSETIQKPGKNQRTTNTVSFDLGNLKASKSFYFILSNTGDTSITDITIESNNANFEVFPKSIDKLAPAGESNIVPLLEIGVIHGNRLNGVGFQSLLAMGDNSVEITLKGKTFGENGQENVELKAQIKLFAEVMDIKVFKAGNEVDLTKPSFSSSFGGQESGLGWVWGYNVGNDPVSIENSGNVKIALEINPSALNSDSNQYYTIEVGEKLDLGEISNKEFKLFVLDGNGTVTNFERLRTGSDGKGYFVLSYQ